MLYCARMCEPNQPFGGDIGKTWSDYQKSKSLGGEPTNPKDLTISRHVFWVFNNTNMFVLEFLSVLGQFGQNGLPCANRSNVPSNEAI